MQHFTLIITHIIALILLWLHPRYWVAKDTAAITADGSAQSLTHAFHARRLLLRLGFVVAVAGLASLPVLVGGGGPGPYIISAAGLAAIGGAYFFFDFNPRLSKARGLDPFYLSKAPGAALWPDRLLTRWGIELKAVLWLVLAAGAVAYLTSLFLLTR